MTTLQDKDLLEMKLGGVLLTDMTAMTFIQWVASKLNGVKAYSAENQELVALVSRPPMSRTMAIQEKIRIIRKLEALNIPIP